MTGIRALNWFVKFLSLVKIPLLGISQPKIIGLTKEKAIVFLPLNWVTKNHLGSMYFGALAMGAELSIALQVLQRIQQEKAPVSFVFKSFSANFLRRADSDVHFCCDEVSAINLLVDKCLVSDERVEGRFRGTARSARVSIETETHGDNVFMEYELVLSLKRKKMAGVLPLYI